MIDLKKIEEQIDELLATETPETLKEWLNSQTQVGVSSYLGEGEFISISSSDIACTVETNSHGIKINEDCENNYVNPIQYATAA